MLYGSGILFESARLILPRMSNCSISSAEKESSSRLCGGSMADPRNSSQIERKNENLTCSTELAVPVIR